MESELGASSRTVPHSGESWINRFTRLVDGLPHPAFIWYIAGGILAISLFALNDVFAFGRPQAAFDGFHLTLAFEPIYALGLMHLLDNRAGQALSRMRPLLIPPEVSEDLHSQLTQLPPRTTLLASIAGLAAGLSAVVIERVALPAVFAPLMPLPNRRFFVELWVVMTWFVFGGLFVHTLHQLRTINRIYVRHTVIDLDYYQPLFHFSKVSALTAIGLAVIPYAWYAAVPHLIQQPVSLAFGAIFLVFAVASFLWPLMGIHNLMVDAKGRALLENASVLKDVRDLLFEHAKERALGGSGELNSALAAIRKEREALLQVPTWPWQPGTPRSVAAALALPLAIWFMQFMLQRVLGR